MFVLVSLLLVSSNLPQCSKQTSVLVAGWNRGMDPMTWYASGGREAVNAELPIGDDKGAVAWKYYVDTNRPAHWDDTADGSKVAAVKCYAQGSETMQAFFPGDLSGGCLVMVRVSEIGYSAFAAHLDSQGHIDGVYEGVGNVVGRVGLCQPQSVRLPKVKAQGKPPVCTAFQPDCKRP